MNPFRVRHYKILSPELGYTKKIRVYLPKGYHRGGPYPVLYMHDGQNVNKKAKWSHASWEVDKTLRKLHKDLIVVAVDCSKNRTQEYCPYPYLDDEPRVGDGKSLAKEYLAFLTKTLKPFIDQRFKVLSDYEHTYTAGSSFGGLISAYAGATCPGIFSKIGVFSIGYSVAGNLFIEDLKRLGSDHKASYFLYVGDKEDEQLKEEPIFMKDYGAYLDFLAEGNYQLLDHAIISGGRHEESSWGLAFARFAGFL